MVAVDLSATATVVETSMVSGDVSIKFAHQIGIAEAVAKDVALFVSDKVAGSVVDFKDVFAGSIAVEASAKQANYVSVGTKADGRSSTASSRLALGAE